MNIYIPNATGIVKFKVAGQNALPKWQRIAIHDALTRNDSPPEALRFQCRIATDARENFRQVNLPDGETLTLHPSSMPQFGKDHNGHAFLTVTLRYSGDGRGYRFKWIGDAVPRKMQEVAVAHDEGRYVRAATIALNLSAAQVTPSWKAEGRPGGPKKNNAETKRARDARYAARLRANGGKPLRTQRTCARLTAEDIAAEAKRAIA